MAVSFVWAASGASFGTGSRVFTVNAAVQVGDKMLAIVGSATPPSNGGWTQLAASNTDANGHAVTLYGKTATSGDLGASVTLGDPSSTWDAGIIMAYRSTSSFGVAVSGVTWTLQGSAATSITLPSLTVLAATMLVRAVVEDPGNQAVTAGAGLTSRTSSQGASFFGLNAADRTVSSAGASSTDSMTTAGSQTFGAYSFALNDAAAPSRRHNPVTVARSLFGSSGLR